MREAVVAVVRRGDRVLVVRRAAGLPFAGRWQPVTGRLEPGEGQAEAVAREVREEVGLSVQPLRKVWECPAEGIDFRLHWWLADWVEGELAPDPREVAEARWLRPAEFAALVDSFASHREFFARIFPSLD